VWRHKIPDLVFFSSLVPQCARCPTMKETESQTPSLWKKCRRPKSSNASAGDRSTSQVAGRARESRRHDVADVPAEQGHERVQGHGPRVDAYADDHHDDDDCFTSDDDDCFTSDDDAQEAQEAQEGHGGCVAMCVVARAS
jgi:hypothetical protein